MKAIVRDRYGSADVLTLGEVPTPTCGDDDVLVKIHAASVNAGDWHLMRGQPFLVRMAFGGLRRPKLRVLGSDFAGRVEAVGRNVRRFRPGDEVFGDSSDHGFGAFAEYARVPEQALAPKPANLSFEEAAAVPLAGRVALQGLRDHGGIAPGRKVLVNGASGGVGTFAVQIAKAHGAEVTGVCSGRNADMVRRIGADHVIDYTREDFTRSGKTWDLILDAAAHRSVLDNRRALSREGVYVMVGGATARMLQTMVLGSVVSRAGTRKMTFMLVQPSDADLAFLGCMVEGGEVRPVIDRRYALREVPEAVAYVEEGHARGKVVVTV